MAFLAGGGGFGFLGGLASKLFGRGGGESTPTTEIDKVAVKKAEDNERRRRRNLRGKELVGIYNANNGLGGIINILGG